MTATRTSAAMCFPSVVFVAALATIGAQLHAAEAAPPRYAPLPVALSSFGAVAADGWLYVYGGHCVRTHSYSTEAVSHRFDRLNLNDPAVWEKLPDGPGLQGMNLAAHGGKIYRVGGMEPRNKPGDPVDNHSTAECAAFDPASGAWESIAPLPQSRSSHDVAVVGDKLYVVGGWSMHGERGDDWLDTAVMLDLAAVKPEWKSIHQPFERRALIATVHDGKIYVLGGFNENDEPSRQVDVYDPASDTWTRGPELPGDDRNGFAPAACTHQGNVYVSVADGTLARLDEAAGEWQKVASTTPRIVHRLASHGSQILVIGGASKGDNLDLIEAVDIPDSARTSAP